jgi:bifunctional enzyme CysN/CysC
MSPQRVITIGNVDDGKSTLVGRLLFETRQVMEDQLASLEKTSRGRGRDELDLALLTDGLRSEREQGVTIDVAHRHFTIGDQRYLLIDAPGHVQYTRNMFTGATHADIALILVDATRGFTDQTFRHCLICAMVGIREVIFLLNKMDLRAYSQQVFMDFASQARIKLEGVLEFKHILPISALKGDNIVESSMNMPWFDGPTVIEALQNCIPSEKRSGDLIFPVQTVEAHHRDGQTERWFCGRIVSGQVSEGDEVAILPAGGTSRVLTLRRGTDAMTQAFAGDSVSLKLSNDIEISRGDVITSSDLMQTSRLRVKLFWMAKTPLKFGQPYVALQGRRQFQVMLHDLESVYDVVELKEKSSAQLQDNEIGTLSLQTSSPMIATRYSRCREMGSFVLVDPVNKNSVAGGIVL